MKYDDLKSDYLMKNPTWHQEDSPYKASKILKILNKNSINPKSIFEVGCGYGGILENLSVHMPDVNKFIGFDISPDAINNAKLKQNNRLSFLNADFTKQPDKCDVLVMADVFEHVEDYIDFIRSCKDKSDYIVFHIPLDISIESILRESYIWTRINFGHLHYFTEKMAISILKDLGLEILDIDYTSELDFPRKSFGSKLTFPIRKVVELVFNKSNAAVCFGGYSIMVLTKTS